LRQQQRRELEDVPCKWGKARAMDKRVWTLGFYFKKIITMKTSIIFTHIISIMFLMGSCSSDEEQYKNEAIEPGSKWKCEGVGFKGNYKLLTFDNISGSNCDDCFTLVFETNYKATGKSTTNAISVDLTSNHPFSISTENAEKDFGETFCKYAKSVTSYSSKKEELDFYFVNEEKEECYLIYKKDK
jgi:hypothetical protein